MYNKSIHGKFNNDDKIKFKGKNTSQNIIWKCSGNTFEDIYDWLLNHNVIDLIDYDPVEKYMEDNNLTNVVDSDYELIIRKENGNAYYQEWIICE